MRDITVERVGKGNYEDFCRLMEWRATGKEEQDISRFKGKEQQDFFRRYEVLDSKTFFAFAARCESKLIGWITAAMIPKADPRLGTLYVDELWVADAYRNRGAAQMLLRETFKIAREMRLWRVRLCVDINNEAGRSLYRKMGFAESGVCCFCELNVEDINI